MTECGVREYKMKRESKIHLKEAYMKSKAISCIKSQREAQHKVGDFFKDQRILIMFIL